MNFDELLADNDPMKNEPYGRHDVASMVARIVRPRTEKISRVVPKFRRLWLAAVASSSATTVGLVALFGSFGSLPVLTLGAAPASQTPKVDGAMVIYARYQFLADSSLSVGDISAAAYQVVNPTDGEAEVKALAQHFGMRENVDVAKVDGNWTATDTHGANVTYGASGMGSFWYNSTSMAVTSCVGAVASLCPPQNFQGGVMTDPTSTVSDQQVTMDAQQLITATGMAYTLTNPTFSVTSDITSSLNGSSTEPIYSVKTANFTVAIDGVATDQSVSVTVNSDNVILSMSGPDFGIASSTKYPLRSPSDGVAALNAAEDQGWGTNVGDAAAGGLPSSGDTTPSTTSETVGPPIRVVTLSRVHLSLATYQLADGSTWLIPEYVFSGTETDVTQTAGSGPWFVIAVDPRYVTVSTALPTGVDGVMRMPVPVAKN
jgi:hypothetical protein